MLPCSGTALTARICPSNRYVRRGASLADLEICNKCVLLITSMYAAWYDWIADRLNSSTLHWAFGQFVA